MRSTRTKSGRRNGRINTRTKEREREEDNGSPGIVVPMRYKYGSCPRENSTLLRSSVSPSHIRLVPAFIRELSLGPSSLILIILIPFSETIHASWRNSLCAKSTKDIAGKLKFIIENIFIPPVIDCGFNSLLQTYTWTLSQASDLR